MYKTYVSLFGKLEIKVEFIGYKNILN